MSIILPGVATAEASPGTPADGVYPFKIGAFQAYSVSDGGGPSPNFTVYPGFPGPAASNTAVSTTSAACSRRRTSQTFPTPLS